MIFRKIYNKWKHLVQVVVTTKLFYFFCFNFSDGNFMLQSSIVLHYNFLATEFSHYSGIRFSILIYSSISFNLEILLHSKFILLT